MIFLKAILLQIFWFIIVFHNSGAYWEYLLIISIGLSLLNILLYKVNVTLVRYLSYLFVFVVWGLIQDYYLVNQKILLVNEHPYWLISLWVLFICYYGDIFQRLSKLSVFLLSPLGALGGAFAYYSGAQLSGLEIAIGREFEYILIVALSWSVFFPLTIKEFHMGKVWDFIMDKSIVFSFDKTGYKRHSRHYSESFMNLDLKGKYALVTGGTSGIGRSVAEFFGDLGCHVTITGRNLKRANDIVAKNPNLKFLGLDLSFWDQIEGVNLTHPLDYLILNAGGMPEKYSTNDKGVELQAASQLVGHFILMSFLKKQNLINKQTRIVWVSSGGMYLKELDFNSLFSTSDYDKVGTYANVKRAQVTLVEDLVNTSEWRGWKIFSMHPGWVKTGGLDEALPGFVSLMNKRLRSAIEGGDTIIWLCLTNQKLESGAFYFDRKKVSPYISDKYRPTPTLREQLITKVTQF